MRARGVSQWRGAVRARGVSQWSCGRDGAYLWHLDEEASRARGVSLGRGGDPLDAVHVDLGDALLASRLWRGERGGGGTKIRKGELDRNIHTVPEMQWVNGSAAGN